MQKFKLYHVKFFTEFTENIPFNKQGFKHSLKWVKVPWVRYSQVGSYSVKQLETTRGGKETLQSVSCLPGT